MHYAVYPDCFMAVVVINIVLRNCKGPEFGYIKGEFKLHDMICFGGSFDSSFAMRNKFLYVTLSKYLFVKR